jgi:hypothetical protein
MPSTEFAKGMLHAYLIPRMVQNAPIDTSKIFAGVTPNNIRAMRPALDRAIRDAVRGKLAYDADIDDLPHLLDNMTDETEGTSPDTICSMVAAAMAASSDEEKQQLIQGLTRILQTSNGNGGSSDAGPLPFPGRPNPGGKLDPVTTPAQDAAFFNRFPDIKKIGLKGGFGT